MNATKQFLKICKIIFIGVLVVAILLNVISILKRVILKEHLSLVLGYGNAVIITGSMEPKIHIGDMVIVHGQQDYLIGDIVTYQGDNSTITHRIIEKTPNGYITQGDANNADDGEITDKQIIGKVVKIIPKAGNVILFLQSAPGVLILIVGFFAIIEISRFIGMIRKDSSENKR